MPQQRDDDRSLEGKVALVTGGTAGMGYHTALALAHRGAHVIVVGRGRDRGLAARAALQAASGNERVAFLPADLSAQADIRRLAADVASRYDRLDLLINNAGVISTRRSTTVDGRETTWAVNYLAPFLLTTSLLPLLEASAPARIITLSSVAHWFGAIRFDDLDRLRHYNGLFAYAQAKLAVNLFTNALARRLDGTGVTANAVDPYAVKTDFTRATDLPLLFKLLRPAMIAPAVGAATTIYLATAPELAGATGGYYLFKHRVPTSPRSHHTALGDRLWQVSVELTDAPPATRER